MRPFLIILNAIFISGCAAAHAPGDVAMNYIEACAAANTGEAADMLAENGRRANPCPPRDISRRLAKQKDAYSVVARIGDAVLIDDGRGFRLESSWLTDADTPQNLMMRFELALKNGSSPLVLSMLAPDIAAHFDNKSFDEFFNAHADRFNALYAALAAHAVPWFEVRSDTAVCEISGIIVEFKNITGKWYFSKVNNLFDSVTVQ